MKKFKFFLLVLIGMVISSAFADHVPSLKVSNQATVASTINLDTVNLIEDGFVVVHAYDNEGGLVLTPPLGLSYLEAGKHHNVVVGLNTAMLAEYGYNAGLKDVLPMIHVDANANQAYEFPEGGDVPAMLEGAMVVAPMTIATTDGMAVFDQTHDNATITIDTANLSEDGFIVVHAFDANDELVLTPPLGVTYLKAGFHRFVKVTLDTDVLMANNYSDTKAVLPMLHVDANANQAYEFPEGGDVPVMVAGEMAVASLMLSQPMMDGDMMAMVEAMDMEVINIEMTQYEVTIPSVTLAQSGFVVLHTADAAGNMVVLPFLAHSDLLPAGKSENVTITIANDTGVLVGDTLFAMAHVDDGDGMYNFPASDGPVVAGGNIVMTKIILE